MGAFLVSASNVGDSSIGGKNNNGGCVIFKGPVEEGETLDIQHMDLINKEDTGDDIGLALFAPVGHFFVNLISYFLFDFTSVSGEQGQETLTSRINHINLVKGHSVHHLFSLFDFTFRTLHVSGLGAHGIVVSGSAE